MGSFKTITMTGKQSFRLLMVLRLAQDILASSAWVSKETLAHDVYERIGGATEPRQKDKPKPRRLEKRYLRSASGTSYGSTTYKPSPRTPVHNLSDAKDLEQAIKTAGSGNLGSSFILSNE